ncbi:MAG TPA: ABC transporter permease, partial [Chloroflexota bacterium]|nr:ABC transporter permease [Chloroflexota bacterium]
MAQLARRVLHAIVNNKMLVAGVVVLILVLLFGVVGSSFVTHEQADVGAGRPARPPDLQHLLGTDQQGRDVLANLIFGTPATLKIGVIAGMIGVSVGTLLGLYAGYVGGAGDAIIRLLIDVFLTIPNLMVLIVIASMLSGVSVEQMGIIIAAWAWMWPARTVRSQVLTIRERAYVQVSRLNGMSPLAIIIRELMPNLMPFVAASLVGTIAAAILASIGLSALGLGPQNEPSIGLTIYWAIFYGALIRQLWWWFVPPIV